MKISDLKQVKRESILNIIFDWGGVITDLDFDASARMFNELGAKDFLSIFSKSYQASFLKEFEIGKITPKGFRNEVRKLLNNDISDAQIDASWNAVLGETPLKRIELLKRLKEKYKLFLLSNTNKIHADSYNKNNNDKLKANHSVLFEKAYYSHDLAIRKPDTEFFNYVIKDSNINPAQTLFIDDTEINIDAAASTGIISFHLNSGLDIVDVFRDW